ncbi:MAG: twin-arginine translocation pathway signal [Xanthobacteraceae bacterium]
MQDRIRKHAAVATIVAAVLSSILVSGCSTADSTVTLFADPSRYQFHSCEQLAGERRQWTAREQELRLLMDRAEQSAGGAVVNVLAYKADHVAASEELRIVEIAARAKNCETPAMWRSNSAVR